MITNIESERGERCRVAPARAFFSGWESPRIATATSGKTPLPRRFARAKAWAARAECPKLSSAALKLMLDMERSNRG